MNNNHANNHAMKPLDKKVDWKKDFRFHFTAPICDWANKEKPTLGELNDILIKQIAFISTLLEEQKIKGAEEYFQMIDAEFEDYPITKAMGEILCKYRDQLKKGEDTGSGEDR